MSLKIGQDRDRFKSIVKGKIRRDLKGYISNDSFTGKKGKDLVTIPIPRINTPRFVYGNDKDGGVGQGNGDIGDGVGDPNGDPQSGSGKAGKDSAEHTIDTEVTIDELTEIMGEELQLPNIEHKGKSRILSQSNKYNGIRRVGPEGLKHFKRSYKEALKRCISTGNWKPGDPIIPIHDDKRYKAAAVVEKEDTSAVIIYIMDVSGSMGEDQKATVRAISFWMNNWLRKQYDGLETRWIIHEADAKEVDEETFFHTHESGGTQISSAYKLCNEIIKKNYPFSEWNTYAFHFSDGDNWSGDDTKTSCEILRKDILPNVNMFGYGQVDSPSGSGDFIVDLQNAFPSENKVVLSRIPSKDAILGSIRDFLSVSR